jgi:small subunit ribosomal protein S20
MPNHKSSEKRVRQTEKRTARNKQWKSKVKNRVRSVRDALASSDNKGAETALPVAMAMLNKASSKGVIPANRAARSISRLMKAVNKANQAAQG